MVPLVPPGPLVAGAAPGADGSAGDVGVVGPPGDDGPADGPVVGDPVVVLVDAVLVDAELVDADLVVAELVDAGADSAVALLGVPPGRPEPATVDEQAVTARTVSRTARDLRRGETAIAAPYKPTPSTRAASHRRSRGGGRCGPLGAVVLPAAGKGQGNGSWAGMGRGRTREPGQAWVMADDSPFRPGCLA